MVSSSPRSSHTPRHCRHASMRTPLRSTWTSSPPHCGHGPWAGIGRGYRRGMRVVADDLSGAVETAAVLGVRRIALRPADGAVVDLDTRALRLAAAAARVRAF